MGPGEEGGVREGGGREEGGSRREGPAETTSFSYVQFAHRELCSAPQGALRHQMRGTLLIDNPWLDILLVPF